MDLERNIADFLGTESSILYSHGFSTIPCMISAFAKRGDIIVADRGINFAIQKGLQISRSTVRWFDHNDLKSLEDVLLSVEKERREPLTRRFIVTEGIFKKDGAMVDLPKLVSCARSETARSHSDPLAFMNRSSLSTSTGITSFLMRASPLVQWAELDAVLQNYTTSPYASPIFRFVVCWLD